MRDADPVSGPTDNNRYPAGLVQDRYDQTHDETRGPAATYNAHAVTLEDEVDCKGWIPSTRPTSAPGAPALNDLWTIGMRGEPGRDDDPSFDNGSGSVSHDD